MTTAPVLERWHAAAGRARTVVCIGDSITYDRPMRARRSVRCNWVQQLVLALDANCGPRAGDGFRALWRTAEWTREGQWREVAPSERYDVAPFRVALVSSGQRLDRLTWTKPDDVSVGAFDLYCLDHPDGGRWHYRVDDGRWSVAAGAVPIGDHGLQRVRVDVPVRERVMIRGHDGAAPCVAAIVGISLLRAPQLPERGTIVHNLGRPHNFLNVFCRKSNGDPLALLDDLRPDLATVMFSNDVSFKDPDQFGANLRRLLERVSRYGDALVMLPFEQRPSRVVSDAVTIAGSTVITSESARFTGTDVKTRLRGTGIAPGATVDDVVSEHEIVMSVPATGSARDSRLHVDNVRTLGAQAVHRAFARSVAESMGHPVLDLYTAWRDRAGGGWDAAYRAGLMTDGLHPTQLGHDDIAERVLAVLGITAR
jgi:lysophospholipase L1-like esterase